MMWRVLIAIVLFTFTKGQCPGRADIIIAIPGNDKIPGQDFFPFEKFLLRLVSYFQVEPHQVNIGLVIYGRQAFATSWLLPFKTLVQTNTRITLTSQRHLIGNALNGKNDVSGAIKLMRHMFQNPSEDSQLPVRSSVQKIGIVFVYDKANPELRPLVVDEATAAKADGITLYAIGKGLTGPEFPMIASDSCKIFSMGRYIDGLPSVLPYLGSSICAEIDPTVNVTAGNCFPELYQPRSPEPVSCPSHSAIFQDPENCAYYYHCLFNQPIQEKCPAGMLFEPTAHICNYKESVTCYSDIQCPAQRGLFPHLTDCDKFLNCYDGIPYVQTCPHGLWYSSKKRHCDVKKNVPCHVYRALQG